MLAVAVHFFKAFGMMMSLCDNMTNVYMLQVKIKFRVGLFKAGLS